MRKLSLAYVVVAIAGCQTVELQYAVPKGGGDYSGAESQANDHYEYFVLSRDYVLVAPTSNSGSVKKGSQDTPAALSGPSSVTSGSAAKPVKSASSPKAPTKADTTANTAQPAQSASSPKAPSGSSDPATASASFDNPLASVTIDGQVWLAKAAPLPDSSQAFVVRGVSGFWKNTTLAVSRYQNTDLVSSVSTTAENLVPKRIGQVASIAASVISIAAVAGVAGARTEPKPLSPFVIELSSQPEQSGSVNEDWTYKLSFDDSGLLPGTVSVSDFKANVIGKTVAYWPVPACRSATLTLFRASENDRKYVFHLIVASPDLIRLQPLPVNGKLELGTICSATASGTATADATTNVVDDLQAVQQAIKTVKDAKKGDTGSKSGGTTGGTTGAARSGTGQ